MKAAVLAEWGVTETNFPVPVRRAAALHLLDGLGTALGAARLGEGRPAVIVALGLGGSAEATVLGTRSRVSAPSAGLANGALVHALDFDDTHAAGLVHATAVVLPAALAVGEQVGATGTEVLDAAIIGYETVCRVAAAAPHGFHARGLHATMCAGVFSAALVSARLLGLDPERTTHALGIAGSQAGGLLAFLSTAASTKHLHPGFASQSGILAARLAQAGATGPATVFDGPQGVFEALTEGPVDPSRIVGGLGTAWETIAMTLKPYPVCQLSHAALDALVDARRRFPFAADEVDTITVDVHPDSASIVCDPTRDLVRPASPYAAKFSLPWSLAALVIDGALRPETFIGESVGRTEVSEMAARVRWGLLAQSVPAADARAQVTVRLRDGRSLGGAVSCSSGTPGRPLARASFLSKLASCVGSDPSRLVALLDGIDDLPNLGPVLAAVADLAERYENQPIST